MRIAAAMLALLGSAEPGQEGRVRVFILAGQSNMEGKAKMELLEVQARDPLFQHWRAGDRWRDRDDVHIRFLDRSGKLTVGFGSPGCVGPELEFGHVVGDRLDDPVLLVKTAWGGRSLYRDFRSPGAGLPVPDVLEKMLADRRKKQPAATLDEVKAAFGASYRAMLQEIRTATAGLKDYELSGFVWLQGWNDMISAEYTAEYAANLAHFIRDVRRDLGAPRLPFVIGQMGVGGLDEQGASVLRFKEAQASAAAIPEFQGTVALVKTDAFWDVEAHAVFKKGWRENLEEWKKVGSDYPYHYLGSARTMLRMGRAFAEAVLRLK